MEFVLNGYFRGQQITGQQRYATEIGNRLLRDGICSELAPTRASARRRELSWLEMQYRLAWRSDEACVISLTYRLPAFAKQQIVTVHDLFVLTNPEWYSPTFRRVTSRLLSRALDRARGIVVVSEPTRRDVEEMFGPQVPVVVAPNAPSEIFHPEPMAEDLRRRLALHSDGYFLSVASLDPRKNTKSLVRAHMLLDKGTRESFPLVLVGGAEASFANVDFGEVDDHIRPVGRVSDHDLAQLYTSATAFVSVSFAEGFGLPVVEAANCGAPLVLSDIESYRWVADQSAVWVSPGDVRSISDGLQRAIDGSASRPGIASKRFDWDESAAAVATMVRDLA